MPNARTRFFFLSLSSSSSCAFRGLGRCTRGTRRFMSDERHGNEPRARDPNNRSLCARRALCAFRVLYRTILGCTSTRGRNLIKSVARSLYKMFCAHSVWWLDEKDIENRRSLKERLFNGLHFHAQVSKQLYIRYLILDLIVSLLKTKMCL